MGGWAEGLACADPGERTPIGARWNSWSCHGRYRNMSSVHGCPCASSFFWALSVVLFVPLFAFDPQEDGGPAEPKLCAKLCSTWSGFWLFSLPKAQSTWSVFDLIYSPFLHFFTNVISFSMSIKLPTFSPSFIQWLDPHHMICCICHFVSILVFSLLWPDWLCNSCLFFPHVFHLIIICYIQVPEWR